MKAALIIATLFDIEKKECNLSDTLLQKILKEKLTGLLTQKKSGKDVVKFLEKVSDGEHSEIFDKKSKALITEALKNPKWLYPAVRLYSPSEAHRFI